MTADLPKIELHLHLEGAAPPAVIRGLAREKAMDLSGLFDANGNYAYRDFWHFLKVYEAATETLKSPEDYHRLTLAVLEESAASGVVYSETFLSPDFCGGRDPEAWKDYLLAIREAADIAERRDGITLRGIVTAIRHFGPEKARETALCAAETAGDWLVGFGLAGDEKIGQPKDFRWSFDCAREAGLRLTAHAGEWGGPAAPRRPGGRTACAPSFAIWRSSGSAMACAPSRIWRWSTKLRNRGSCWRSAPARTSRWVFTRAGAPIRSMPCANAG
jgi:adenosine deaminase